MSSLNGKGKQEVVTVLPESLIAQFASSDIDKLFERTAPRQPEQVTTANFKGDEFFDNQSDFARLLYLLVEYKITLPPLIARYLPYGNELSQAHLGLGCIGPLDVVSPLYRKGKAWGVGSIDECIEILFRAVEPAMSELPIAKRMEIFTTLQKLHTTENSALIEFEEFSFGEEQDTDEIPKFDSGFVPLDTIQGGLYQGLMVFMGTPGTGKTSIMLTLMTELIEKGYECWFFENEIPGRMMKARTSPLRRRLGLTPLCKIFTGPHNVFTIIDKVKENPNPDRIIFFDGPDVDAGVHTGVGHEDLGEAYRALVRLKMMSALVVVSSQTRRSDNELTMKSVAEAWKKTHYADILISLDMSSFGVLKMKVLKNRFGPLGRSIYFHYDYINLSWSLDGVGENDWSDIMPDKSSTGEQTNDTEQYN